MKTDRMRGVWDRVREKQSLNAAGIALVERETGFLPSVRLLISAACAIAVAIAPVTGAAGLVL